MTQVNQLYDIEQAAQLPLLCGLFFRNGEADSIS